MIGEGRYTAELDDDFVLFLIGMRFNALWKVHRWLPVFRAMPRMIRELQSGDHPGLLHSRTTISWRGLTMIQYWADFDSLRKYARTREGEHYEAWIDYNREVADTDAVGIWHETYLVEDGCYEAVYNRMPRQGLAEAGEVVRADGRSQSAAGRLRRTDGTDAPITPDGTET